MSAAFFRRTVQSYILPRTAHMDFWARRRPWTIVVGLLVFAGLALLLANALALLLYGLGVAGLVVAQIVALLLATAITLRFVDRAGTVTVGLGWGGFAGREIGVGGMLGLGLALLTVTCIGLAAWIGGGAVAIEPRAISSMTWIGSVVLVLVHAAGEELLYRGYLFQRLDELVGSVAATAASVGLFVCAHAGNPGVTPLGLLSIALGGLLFSLLVLRTGSLWSAIFCHALWNLTIGPLCGLPVSGVIFDGGSLIGVRYEATGTLTGGAFGPEGSLVAVVVVASGCLGVLLLRWFDTRPERFARRFHALYRRARLVAGETRRDSSRRSAHLSGQASSADGSSPYIND